MLKFNCSVCGASLIIRVLVVLLILRGWQHLRSANMGNTI